MSDRLIKALAVGVVALLALWLVSERLTQRPTEITGDFRIPPVDSTAVQSVSIEGPDASIRLERDGDRWLVNGLPADPMRIAEMTDALAEDPTAVVAGESEATHASFEVDDAGARRVTVQVGDSTPIDVLVGKAGPTGDTRFVRNPGDATVYTIRGTLGAQVDRSFADWRDRRVVAAPQDSIGQVEINRYGSVSRLTRGEEEGEWLLGQTVADTSTVRFLFQNLDPLRAAGFPTAAQMDSVELETPDRRLEVFGTDGRILAGIAFDSTNTGFWARADGDSLIYRLDRYRVEQVTPADSVLLRNSRGG